MARDLSQKLRELVIHVEPGENEMRLDHFLGERVFWRSRTDLQSRIKAGTVLLNGSGSKSSSRVKTGDTVTVMIRPEDLPDQDPSTIPIDVLFEDESIIVVNKQADLIVHPTGKHVYDTLMNALHLRYRLSGEADQGVEPHVVHRLDRNTSGVLVVAKTQEAKQALYSAFSNRRVGKSYLALCEGTVADDKGEIEQPIGPDTESHIRIKMAVRPDGQASRTSWEVVERVPGHSLVKVRLHTGRQHQIRLHLSWLGHPILCDPLYGDPRSVGLAEEPDAPILDRQALHASEISIEHPVTGEVMEFHAPFPKDMEKCLDHLRSDRHLDHLADHQSSRWV